MGEGTGGERGERRFGEKERGGQGRAGQGRERTTLRNPCPKFLSTPLVSGSSDCTDVVMPELPV